MSDDVKARVERARELDQLLPAGPYEICAARDGQCSCGQVWSVPLDVPVLAIRQVSEENHGAEHSPEVQRALRRYVTESRTLLPALAADCERLQRRVAELEAAARIDDSLEATAQRLIGAAHAYWKKLGSEIGQRAVIWLEDTSGRLVIFTRGEYREQLMRNIGLINRPHYFAKTGPEQED